MKRSKTNLPRPSIVSAEPRLIGRLTLATVFIVAGALHFARPATYAQIVPPGFGPPRVIVAISGAAEIAGGVGVLVPRLLRPAGWGLVALLVCVFPANVYMLVARERFASIPAWALWARLPLQAALIAWVWHATLRRSRVGDSAR